jgi:hypothetical protein
LIRWKSAEATKLTTEFIWLPVMGAASAWATRRIISYTCWS